jgi:hypothetical protein
MKENNPPFAQTFRDYREAHPIGQKQISMTVRYAHLAPHHQLAALERLAASAPVAQVKKPNDPRTSTSEKATSDEKVDFCPLSLSRVICCKHVGLVAQRLEQRTHKTVISSCNLSESITCDGTKDLWAQPAPGKRYS